jgi:hypothetical protein
MSAVLTVAAKQATVSADSVLPATALANESNAAICARDATASAAPALPKYKRHQEEAAAKQYQLDNERIMALDMPPNPIDAAIWHIQAKCALRAAPLDTILAKSARDDIVQDAPAPPTTTLPHPMAMLSTPPVPYDLCGRGPFYDGGEPSCEVPRSCTIALTFTYGQGCLRPHAPSLPDKVLTSHPHPPLKGLPTPTKTLTTLAPVTSPCCSVVS